MYSDYGLCLFLRGCFNDRKYHLAVLDYRGPAGSPGLESRCCQGRFLLEAPGQKPFPGLSSIRRCLLSLAGGPALRGHSRQSGSLALCLCPAVTAWSLALPPGSLVCLRRRTLTVTLGHLDNPGLSPTSRSLPRSHLQRVFATSGDLVTGSGIRTWASKASRWPV